MKRPDIHRLVLAPSAGLLLLLAGCGSNSSWPIAGSVIKNAVLGAPGTGISRENLSKIPYAMITARVGKGRPAILVLASSDGHSRQWMATNEVSIITRNGRIVQTVGFPNDVRRSELLGSDPLAASPHLLGDTAYYQKTLYFYGNAAGPNLAVSLRCALTAGARTTIEIAEIMLEVIVMEETCVAGSGKKRTSLFWIDPYDGFAWQSKQEIFEGYPPVTISVLKPES